MRISDCSSDLCSSDLLRESSCRVGRMRLMRRSSVIRPSFIGTFRSTRVSTTLPATSASSSVDRKSVVEGKSVSVRVDFGGRRIIKKTTEHNTNELILTSLIVTTLQCYTQLSSY